MTPIGLNSVQFESVLEALLGSIRSWAILAVVVVVGPPGRCATGAKPRLRRAIAPEGLHVAGKGCGQGRDDVRVSHRLWRRVDGAQEAEAGPRQARAPQKDVPWRVRLLSADYAAGGWAVPRAASGTGWCRLPQKMMA